MFLPKILLKVTLLPVILILLILKVVVKIGMEISSVLLGSLILFVTGCLIYTIMKQNWNQMIILILTDAALMAITIGTGIIEGLINNAIALIFDY